jgi:hypothetical protein
MVLSDAAQSPLSRPDAALLVAKAALHIAVELIPELANSSAFLGHDITHAKNEILLSINNTAKYNTFITRMMIRKKS